MDYIQRLDRLRVTKGWSINKLVSKCNLSESCIKKILSGKTSDPRVSTVEKICKAMDVSMAELFRNDSEIVSTGSSEMVALVPIFESMPVKAKVYLLSFLESYKQESIKSR